MPFVKTHAGVRVLALPVISASVDPAEVREGRPFKVTVTFKLGVADRSPDVTPGRLVVTVEESDSTATIQVPALEQNQEFKKSVQLIAGRAGLRKVRVDFFSDASPAGEEFPGAVGSCVADLRVRAQFFVTLDRMNVGQTRASTRDVDYIWFSSQFNDGEAKTDYKVIHDVGIAPHRVDLAVGPFEFVPETGGPKQEFRTAFIIMNKGFEGSAEQKAKEVGDKFAQFAGGAFGAAFAGQGGGNSGQSAGAFGSLANATVELHDIMVNHGLGADGVVANEYVLANASLVEERTKTGAAYEIETLCHGLSSGDATGSVQPSRYTVFAKFHRDATVYRVRVKTGDVDDAETDSHVFITIRGERGSTEEQELDDIHRNFQQGASELFRVVGKDVGRITGIRIRHDNSFDDKSWFLQEVTVEDASSNESASFVYNDWLSLTVGRRTNDVEITRQ